jgi:hypothetical protein
VITLEKKIMKNKLNLLTLVVLLATVFLAPSAAHAQCTNASLTGGWGYLMQFNIPFIGPISVPVLAQSGLFVFDGAGHFTLTDDRIEIPNLVTAGGSGVIARQEQSNGTYVVNPDCTGMIIVHQSPQPVAGHLFVNGKLIEGPAVHISITLTAPALNSGTMAFTDQGWEFWVDVNNSNCATVNKAACNTFQPFWTGTMTQQ